jgi:hypothetical protein
MTSQQIPRGKNMLKVRELIEILSALPEEQKDMRAACTYALDHGWTDVIGIKDVLEWNDKEGHHAYVRLQGE